MGTGAGIAFFMLLAHRTGDAATVAATARIVVIADFVFTATAVVVQPITGVALIYVTGYSFAEDWVWVSIMLYIVTGLFWLPVVWMQWRMRDLAAEAQASGEPLPLLYHRLFSWWFASGFPAFAAVAAIYWLMITRPIDLF
ncbi:membrane protein [Rhizobium albus]|nr:membrane protein [Rhizobium albus]